MTIFAADYGAGPDRSPEENTRALQAALREAAGKGGDEVVLAAGEYLPLDEVDPAPRPHYVREVLDKLDASGILRLRKKEED